MSNIGNVNNNYIFAETSSPLQLSIPLYAMIYTNALYIQMIIIISTSFPCIRTFFVSEASFLNSANSSTERTVLQSNLPSKPFQQFGNQLLRNEQSTFALCIILLAKIGNKITSATSLKLMYDRHKRTHTPMNRRISINERSLRGFARERGRHSSETRGRMSEYFEGLGSSCALSFKRFAARLCQGPVSCAEPRDDVTINVMI